ncbi:phage virion morphogenesis protein [Capnocytophaga canis]|uniref:phage virion morphogenesis protein n=1 Tax=Capnocytophaga canis TaxID=1848903 RepID=UPI0015626210|nr:phage virion morphogenesis protein [Capnocytophaga canis]
MDIEFKGDFFAKLEKVSKHTFLRRMTAEVGIIAVNFSKDRFQFKNWIDKGGAEKWKPRQRKGRGSLLVRSGRLKRSIRKIITGDYYVVVGTDVPYAQIHNEGGEINKTVRVRGFQRKINIRARKIDRATGRLRKMGKPIGQMLINVRSHNRKMNLQIPRRQFLGNSEFLAKRIEKYVTSQIDNELKN